MHALTVALMFVSLPAVAGPPEQPEPRYALETIIDFRDGVDVKGELVRPMGDLYTERVRGQFDPLIRLRASFTDRMRASTRAVR